MTNTQIKNNQPANEQAKASLRGEAPQEHGVKGKKARVKNPETEAARALLIVMSQQAQEMMAAAEEGEELDGFEDCEKVNDFLIVMHQQASGCETFKTFQEWKKDGYTVKKGSKAYRVWGSPLKAKKAGEAEAEAPKAEDDKDTKNTFKYWPMCCLFSEAQVERQNAEPEVRGPEATPQGAAPGAADCVPVAKFRRMIEALENQFHTHRHACVGADEWNNWRRVVVFQLAELQATDCKRAKPEDLERKAAIVETVSAYLDSNPTPPDFKRIRKTDTKEQYTAEVHTLDATGPAAGDTLNRHVLDLGNNESLSRGLFPQANGTFLAMTYTESKPFKTRAGALGWLAARGLDANGQTIEAAQPQEATEGEDSPFVTADYQEMQEARKERLIVRADTASAAFQDTYNKARKMAEVIPFGQPILVGHHSEKRDRRYRDKIHNTFGKAFALDQKADHYRAKAATVGTAGIASNDPEALQKLREKLAGLEKSQATMKAVNKIIRANLTEAEKRAEIVGAGLLSESMAEEILQPGRFGGMGFASFRLSNNNAEIRRTKQRVDELERLRASDPLEFSNDDFSASIDNGRVCFVFSGGKPSDEVRELMRRAAFKWSRYQGAWVRKATANAIPAAKRLLAALQLLETIY